MTLQQGHLKLRLQSLQVFDRGSFSKIYFTSITVEFDLNITFEHKRIEKRKYEWEFIWRVQGVQPDGGGRSAILDNKRIETYESYGRNPEFKKNSNGTQQFRFINTKFFKYVNLLPPHFTIKSIIENIQISCEFYSSKGSFKNIYIANNPVKLKRFIE